MVSEEAEHQIPNDGQRPGRANMGQPPRFTEREETEAASGLCRESGLVDL